MSSQFSANINLMVGAALKAGRGLIRDFGEVEKLQVSVKGPADFVSKADIRAESVVREELCEGRPNYGWCGEESEPIEGKDPTRRWIVDPLDGTTNFLHGLPLWCVSIALEHKGKSSPESSLFRRQTRCSWRKKAAAPGSTTIASGSLPEPGSIPWSSRQPCPQPTGRVGIKRQRRSKSACQIAQDSETSALRH